MPQGRGSEDGVRELALPSHLVKQGLLAPTAMLCTPGKTFSALSPSHLTIGALGLQMLGTTSGFGLGGYTWVLRIKVGGETCTPSTLACRAFSLAHSWILR